MPCETCERFASFHRKADVLDGNRLLVLPVEKPANGACETGKLFISPKRFGQAVDFNCGHSSPAKKHKKPKKGKII